MIQGEEENRLTSLDGSSESYRIPLSPVNNEVLRIRMGVSGGSLARFYVERG